MKRGNWPSSFSPHWSPATQISSLPFILLPLRPNLSTPTCHHHLQPRASSHSPHTDHFPNRSLSKIPEKQAAWPQLSHWLSAIAPTPYQNQNPQQQCTRCLSPTQFFPPLKSDRQPHNNSSPKDPLNPKLNQPQLPFFLHSLHLPNQPLHHCHRW